MKNKRLLPLILFSLLSSTTFFRQEPTLAHQGTNKHTVNMTKDGFEPSNIKIENNETVIFENSDSQDRWPASNNHPTHEIYIGFDPQKPIKPGESWEFKFEIEGQWQFHDHLYPQMKGTITVAQKLAQEDEKNNNFLAGISEGFKNLKNSLAKLISFLPSFNKNNQDQSPGKFKNISEIKNTNSSEVYKNLNFDCKPENYNCISDTLKKITSDYGPQTATEILDKLNEDKRFSENIDDHQFSHEIGRQTADAFGYNGQSFLLCPMSSYNGGCQHGFFETALGKAQSSKEAIDLVCGSLEDDAYSSKFRFYCYHGVGHGVMMAEAYSLNDSLTICDSLTEPFAQDGCWQGVFMENANAGMRHEAKVGVFSETDPLAPCNVVEEKYRHECFINHAGPLMVFFKNDVEKATLSCLKAPENYSSSCLQSIGLMVTNPAWQPQLLKSQVQKTLWEGAWEICLKFPKNHQDQCIVGAVDNLMNFNELQIEQSDTFCSIVASIHQNLCYQKIGANLRNQTTDSSVVSQKCSEIENNNFSKNCLKGAGL